MASTKEYLNFVLDQLSGLEGIKYRPMMGEYLLYCRGKVVGGVYDDRLLIKPLPSALRVLEESGREWGREFPYEGAKEMLAADPDDRELIRRVIEAAAGDLPEKRRKNAQKTL